MQKFSDSFHYGFCLDSWMILDWSSCSTKDKPLPMYAEPWRYLLPPTTVGSISTAACRRSRPEAISHRGQAAQGAGTGELSAEAFACRGRTRQSDAQGACCAVRRTLRCDGKLLSPERRCAAKRTSRCDELSWFCRIDFELPSAVPAVWSAKNRTTQRRPAPVAARCQLYRRRSS